MRKKSILFQVACVSGMIFWMSLYSQDLSAQKAVKQLKQAGWLFEENAGQLTDENGVFNKEVKYFGGQAGVNVFCTAKGVSFLYSRNEGEPLSEATMLSQTKEDLEAQVSNMQVVRNRMDMLFEGGNKDVEIIAEGKQAVYKNYFTAAAGGRGIERVKTYKKIRYKNLYANIDMLLTSGEKGLKYEFIVHPGGHINDIRLKWHGTGSMQALANGGIRYENSLGEMLEQAPYTYQADGKEINSRFVKTGQVVSFSLEGYDKKQDLVIDPWLSWATYDGGNLEDKVYGVKIDTAGNIYAAGAVQSTTNIATSGAYQTTYGGGGWDVYLSKFDSAGNILWATYYGGSDMDAAYDMDIDSFGNAYVTGYAWSTTAIATSGAYQTSNNGVADALLAKFSTNGSLLWGTYLGGSNTEYAQGVFVDRTGDVYVHGITYSTSSIASAGAAQTTFGGGSTDAFLAKFSSTGTRLWSTYFGGNADDRGFSVGTDAAGYVYTGGATSSTSGLATSGAYQTAYGGGIWDNYIAKYDKNGALQFSTYFGGSDQETIYDLAVDDDGNIYGTGFAWSTSGIATPGVHQTTNNGVADVLLTKFNSSGKRVWATYFGGSASDFAKSIVMDRKGRLYLGGATLSTSSIATADGYQTTHGGGSYDAFVATFDTSGHRKWATYYGGSGHEEGVSIAIDSYKSIVLGGLTSSTSAVAKGNAHQSTYGGGTYDVLIARFTTPPLYIGKDTMICAGSCLSLKSNVVALSYKWSTGATASGITYCPNKSDTVTLTAYLDNDTLVDSIIVGIYPSQKILVDADTICRGDSVQINTPGAYRWLPKTGVSDTASGNPWLKPEVTTKYYVYLENAQGCTTIDSLTIYVGQPLEVSLRKAKLCKGDSLQISVPGTHTWNTTAGISDPASLSPWFKPLVSTKYRVQLKNFAGCIYEDSIEIDVDSTCLVWPGDANWDKIADIYDVFNIGIAYSGTGPARSGATPAWVGQPCADWNGSFANGANYKHADCNGNGLVDTADLRPLILNYSKTHNKTTHYKNGVPTDPHLYVDFDRDSVYAGDTLRMDFYLGTAAKPVEDVYGFAVKFAYDNKLVKNIFTQSKSKSSWFGKIDTTLITMVRNDANFGKAEIAMCRINQTNVTGYGKVGELSIVVQGDIAGKRQINEIIKMGVEDVRMISYDETELPLYFESDSVVAWQIVEGVKETAKLGENISLYPNPASDVLNIECPELVVTAVKIYNALGQEVYTSNPQKKGLIILPVKDMQAGVYSLTITTPKGNISKSFIKQ